MPIVGIYLTALIFGESIPIQRAHPIFKKGAPDFKKGRTRFLEIIRKLG
jgi:hypothetical protein